MTAGSLTIAIIVTVIISCAILSLVIFAHVRKRSIISLFASWIFYLLAYFNSHGIFNYSMEVILAYIACVSIFSTAINVLYLYIKKDEPVKKSIFKEFALALAFSIVIVLMLYFITIMSFFISSLVMFFG